MLIRINEEYVIKSDTYQFCLCEDKGLTRFPNNVEAMYYKPLYFYGKISLVIEKLIKLGVEIPDWCHRIAEIDKEINEFANSGFDFKKIKIGNINLSSKGPNDFMIKCGSYNTYPTSYNGAVYFLWQLYLRIDNRFGSYESQTPDFSDIDEIEKATEEFKSELSGFIVEEAVN